MPRGFFLVPVALLSLASCDASERPGEDLETVDLEGSVVDPPPPPPPSPDNTREVVNDGYPDLAPAELTREAERTETGARNVLLSWARAIELKEFDQAHALMSEADRRRWSREEWADLFENLGTITVAVPGGTMEGAAGSAFYTAPVTVTGSLADIIVFQGQVVLRRVNDLPGSSAGQRRWRIERVELYPADE